MSAHTPGPWYHVGGSDARSAPFIRAVGDVVPGTMAIASVCHRGRHAEHLANARLIAAAPDLLGAISFLLDCSEPMTAQQKECWVSLQAARAKATGGKP